MRKVFYVNGKRTSKSNESHCIDLNTDFKTSIYLSEQILLNPLYTSCKTLNHDITLEEVNSVINKAKFRKLSI